MSVSLEEEEDRKGLDIKLWYVQRRVVPGDAGAEGLGGRLTSAHISVVTY